MAEHETLAAAIAAVQANLPDVRKTETANIGNSHSYRYADLADVSQAILPLLGKNGLSFVAKPTLTERGQFVLAYKLLHTSGQEEAGEFPLSGSTAQQMGSAITYARRYTLCAVTGLAPDKDDDGAAAAQVEMRPAHDEWENAQPAPRARQRTQNDEEQPPARFMTQRHLAALHAKLGDAELSDRDKGLAYINEGLDRDVASTKDLTAAEFRTVMDRLDKYIRQNTPPESEAE